MKPLARVSLVSIIRSITPHYDLNGENLKVVLADLATLSWAILCMICTKMHAVPCVENSARGLFRPAS